MVYFYVIIDDKDPSLHNKFGQPITSVRRSAWSDMRSTRSISCPSRSRSRSTMMNWYSVAGTPNLNNRHIFMLDQTHTFFCWMINVLSFFIKFITNVIILSNLFGSTANCCSLNIVHSLACLGPCSQLSEQRALPHPPQCQIWRILRISILLDYAWTAFKVADKNSCKDWQIMFKL